MTVFTRAIKTSKWNPLPKAAIKMKNFEKKPAKGGIPANEKRERVRNRESLGFVLYSPL